MLLQETTIPSYGHVLIVKVIKTSIAKMESRLRNEIFQTLFSNVIREVLKEKKGRK